MGRRSPAGLLAELHSRPGREVTSWLAFDSDRPVGFAAAVVAGACGVVRHSIAWLLVSDDRRRHGVGRALVAAAVTRARERGAAEVWVETRSDWIDAVAFWRAVGFRAPA
jgi:GNAT superfamily N-acetyltransferase